MELQKVIEDKNINVLFIEPQLSKQSIQTFANDLNVELKVLDPLGGVDGRRAYFDLIEYNLDKLSK